jgi:uncharacterized small protein (DUF1192 family)
MSRKSQLDLAIEGIEYDIKVLQASLARLVAQREAQTAKKATS